MEIGVVPDPLNWDRWNEAKALLEPARARGDFPACWEPDELLWACVDAGELLACATAWLSKSGYVEVKLVGGKGRHRWLAELDRRIGVAAAEAGATHIAILGRAGWAKSLKALGWASEGDGRKRLYRRSLEG